MSTSSFGRSTDQVSFFYTKAVKKSRGRSMNCAELRQPEVRRIPHPRTPVNMRCGQKFEVITSCMNEEGFHAVELRNVKYFVDAPVTNHQLNELFAASWDAHQWTDFEALLRHSLGYVCARLGEELIGFVNLAWDGGRHAFILDTTVHPDLRGGCGIGPRLVRQAVEVAEDRSMKWVHVDFEEHLRGFYLSCGFRPTEAGLLHLTEPHLGP